MSQVPFPLSASYQSPPPLPIPVPITVAATSMPANPTKAWLLDSACARSMCGDQFPKAVTDIKPTSATASMANGSRSAITHKALLHGMPLYSVSDRNFQTNLLSIGEATKSWGNKFIFIGDSCLLLKQDAQITINSSDIINVTTRNEAGVYAMTDREFNRSFQK